jgi:glycosyltransferase involved in cell wall biosynthesis
VKIIHIITGLGVGGAEHTLYKLCKYDIYNKHIVISLSGSEKYFYLLRKLGISVYLLNLKFYSINKFFLLIKILRYLKPDIVQTWLVHADLIGGIAARLSGIKNIIWNIRHSDLEIKKTKLSTVLFIIAASKIFYLFIPQFIIVVFKNPKKIYKIKNYNKNKLKYIPNGYDLSILKPSKFQKKIFRKRIKIAKSTILIGNVSRYDPKKNHLILLNALSLIRSKNVNFFCVLAGYKITQDNIELISLIKKLKLSKYVKLLGETDNIIEIMNGLDIYVQTSSYGEGFPNVVAEAMSCGVPCVVTDVGDSSLIVGKTGWIVPPNNLNKLANTILRALNEKSSRKWSVRCDKARSRIKEKFGIMRMTKSYNKIWSKIYCKNI